MKRLAAAALLSVAACGGGPVNRSEATDIAEDQADAQVAPVASRLADAETEIALLESKVERLESRLNIVDADVSATSNLVSKNARASNYNAVQAMTRRGACGTELVTLSNGTILNRNKECTEKDLAPSTE
jgi:septal ring factor EnvC (AmiA/AmiB activator)